MIELLVKATVVKLDAEQKRDAIVQSISAALRTDTCRAAVGDTKAISEAQFLHRD